MFRLVIAVPSYVASLALGDEAARVGAQGGWVSVNASQPQAHGGERMQRRSHTRIGPSLVSLRPLRSRARTSIPCRRGASMYFDVRNGRALGLCQRDRQSG